jgi:hypothetical protein
MPPRKHDAPTIEGDLVGPAAAVFAPAPPPVPDAVVAPGGDVAGRPWLDMTTAPRDGTLVELDCAGAQPVIGVWRITRRRRPTVRGWHLTAFWSDPVTREEISGEPLGWRMPAGYLTPGMIA